MAAQTPLVKVEGKYVELDSSDTLDLNTGQRAALVNLSVATKTANYTLTNADDVILVDCTSASRTITLHAVATAQQKPYIIKKIDSSANALTIDGNASETIDGATTQTTTVQYTSFTIVPNNAGEWNIV